MPCWVAPIIAAEIWGLPKDCIAACLRDGSILAKTESGFVFLDVTSRISQTAAIARHRSLLGWPPTFTQFVTPAESAALHSSPLLPAASELAPPVNSEGATRQFHVAASTDPLNQWPLAGPVSESAISFHTSLEYPSGSHGFSLSTTPAGASHLATDVRQAALFSAAPAAHCSNASTPHGSPDDFPRSRVRSAPANAFQSRARSRHAPCRPGDQSAAALTPLPENHPPDISPSEISQIPPDVIPASVHDEDELPLSPEAEENEHGPDIRNWRSARQAASRLRKPPPRRATD
jgi:hypothetical protein